MAIATWEKYGAITAGYAIIGGLYYWTAQGEPAVKTQYTIIAIAYVIISLLYLWVSMSAKKEEQKESG